MKKKELFAGCACGCFFSLVVAVVLPLALVVCSGVAAYGKYESLAEKTKQVREKSSGQEFETVWRWGDGDENSPSVARLRLDGEISHERIGRGLFGIDWNPISQEEMLENAHIETVFWTDSGTVYHAYDDCGHLSNTVNLNTGTSATAIENGKTRLCKSCEARAQREAEAAEENNEENKTPADTAAEANQ